MSLFAKYIYYIFIGQWTSDRVRIQIRKSRVQFSAATKFSSENDGKMTSIWWKSDRNWTEIKKSERGYIKKWIAWLVKYIFFWFFSFKLRFALETCQILMRKWRENDQKLIRIWQKSVHFRCFKVGKVSETVRFL